MADPVFFLNGFNSYIRYTPPDLSQKAVDTYRDYMNSDAGKRSQVRERLNDYAEKFAATRQRASEAPPDALPVAFQPLPSSEDGSNLDFLS